MAEPDLKRRRPVADRAETGPDGGVKASLAMTNDDEPGPSDEGRPVTMPAYGGTLLHARPASATIAAALWIVLGATIVATATAVPVTSPVYDLPAKLLLVGYGAALIIGASRMLRGSERARTTVTVMGCLLLFGLWTALLIVPALILQYRPDSRAWFRSVNARPSTSPARRKNSREIGILFDIDALGGAAYEREAYKILFASLDPRRLRNCSLRAGDTHATLNGTARLFCIAIRSSDPRQIDYVRLALRTRTDDGLPDGEERFLAGAVASREPLDHAADIDEAGTLIADPDGTIQPWVAEGTAWKVISE